MATTDKKEACPRCFAETGQSVVLKKEGEEYVCPKNPEHRFKREGDFLVKIE